MNDQNLFQSSTYFKLDRAFFIKLLELEKLFHEKEINIQQIGELVGMYARCTEYYDSIKDDSKYYYMDKIQYVLSRKESLEMIFKEGQQDKKESNGINVKGQVPKDLLVSDFVIDINFGNSAAGGKGGAIDLNSNDREFRVGNIRCSIAGRPANRESVTRRKMQGEYKMNVDFYEHKGEQEYQMKHIVEETEQKFEQNDEIIKKDLNDQDELLMQRIAKKKAKLNQKKKKLNKANSFDEIELNNTANTNITTLIEDNSQNGNNKGNNNLRTEIEPTQNLYQSQHKKVQTVDKNISKKDQINELKEAFDLSYSKLFTSISQKQNRPSVAIRQQLPVLKENESSNSNNNNDVKITLTNSLFDNSLEQLNRESANPTQNILDTQDHLESIFSTHGGRITIRGENPFEESDDEDDE